MYWLAYTTNPAPTRTRLVIIMVAVALLAITGVTLALTKPPTVPTFELKQFSQNHYTATIRYTIENASNNGNYDLWLLYSPASAPEDYVVYQTPPFQMIHGEHVEIVPVFPSEGGGTVKFYAAPHHGASEVLSAMSYTGNTAVEGYHYANHKELPSGMVALAVQAYADPQ